MLGGGCAPKKKKKKLNSGAAVWIPVMLRKAGKPFINSRTSFLPPPTQVRACVRHRWLNRRGCRGSCVKMTSIQTLNTLLVEDAPVLWLDIQLGKCCFSRSKLRNLRTRRGYRIMNDPAGMHSAPLTCSSQLDGSNHHCRLFGWLRVISFVFALYFMRYLRL